MRINFNGAVFAVCVEVFDEGFNEDTQKPFGWGNPETLNVAALDAETAMAAAKAGLLSSYCDGPDGDLEITRSRIVEVTKVCDIDLFQAKVGEE